MQTLNLIIPMAGIGKRFTDKNYKTYKTLLKVDNFNTVYDKIISNFKHKRLRIILIINREISKKYKKKFSKKNLEIITINKHENGPTYSIYQAWLKINELIKEDEKIFISYSDINWNWNFKKVLNYLKNKEICVFTHTGFHPHLEANDKSDFCKINKNKIFRMSQKKTFLKDYKKDHLAIGCYFFKNIGFINNYFKEINKFNKKKEYYLLSVINHLINKNVKVFNFNVSNFVHLGIPEQYEDFINWRNEIKKKNNYLNNKKLFKNYKTIMLMAGQGSRLKKFKNEKFLLYYKGKNIFKYILSIYGSKENTIITTKNLKKKIPYNNNTKIVLIKKNNSMFKTILESSKILLKEKNFFLTSCDCFGEFDVNLLRNIQKRKIDLCLFGFDFSITQKKLNNAHTQLVVENNIVKNIKVKSFFNEKLMGHAGFFWINSKNVFKHISNFISSDDYRSLKREIIIDDYFKYIAVKKLIKVSYIKLKNYIHIGSTKEYKEYKYWKDYFLNDSK
jgi:CTP:molybdopterin cytidylyltransferase MocA